MVSLKEAKLSFEKYAHRLNPFAPEISVIKRFEKPQKSLTKEDLLFISNQGLGLIVDKLENNKPKLEKMNPFGIWETINLEEVKKSMVNHIEQSMIRDNDGGLLGVEMKTYRKFLGNNNLYFNISEVDWTMNFATISEERFGDGPRFQNQTQNKFLFIQKRRIEIRESPFYIRQKK